jgi:hypothetical protein
MEIFWALCFKYVYAEVYHVTVNWKNEQHEQEIFKCENAGISTADVTTPYTTEIVISHVDEIAGFFVDEIMIFCKSKTLPKNKFTCYLCSSFKFISRTGNLILKVINRLIICTGKCMLAALIAEFHVAALKFG